VIKWKSPAADCALPTFGALLGIHAAGHERLVVGACFRAVG